MNGNLEPLNQKLVPDAKAGWIGRKVVLKMNIVELHSFCIDHKLSIVVHKGKISGFLPEGDWI